MRASISLAWAAIRLDERGADVAAPEHADADLLLCHGRRGYGSAPSSSQCVAAAQSHSLGIVRQRHGVAEVDAHVARREDRVAVERHDFSRLVASASGT